MRRQLVVARVAPLREDSMLRHPIDEQQAGGTSSKMVRTAWALVALAVALAQALPERPPVSESIQVSARAVPGGLQLAVRVCSTRGACGSLVAEVRLASGAWPFGVFAWLTVSYWPVVIRQSRDDGLAFSTNGARNSAPSSS
jgi:hypothetical protein